jgi:S-adenosylmethionine:tRNA ribosyltransferase-isomerase
VNVADFDYVLPPEAIAQRPAPRGTARLLTLDRRTGAVSHRQIADLPELLRPGDLLVVNDTKVVPARIFGSDEKGRRTEFLVVERATQRPEVSSKGGREGDVWRCLAKPGSRVKAGRKFFFEMGWEGEALEGNVSPHPPPLLPSKKGAETIRAEAGAHASSRAESGFDSSPVAHSTSKKSNRSEQAAGGLYTLRFHKRGSTESLLSDLPALGSAPLPPYIHRPGGEADERDREDYQTVYAAKPGAIAAPTAGLHFTAELLATLAGRGVELARVTLHVGLGTFRPVTSERVEEHTMDPERGEIPEAAAAAIRRAKAEGRRVVAVGTTTVRTLEGSAAARGEVVPGPFETNLFLVPGANFRVVDALLTNFHLPRSTLLMLVSAFAGRETVLAAYREAIRRGYRFFSYGDAMFIA